MFLYIIFKIIYFRINHLSAGQRKAAALVHPFQLHRWRGRPGQYRQPDPLQPGPYEDVRGGGREDAPRPNPRYGDMGGFPPGLGDAGAQHPSVHPAGREIPVDLHRAGDGGERHLHGRGGPFQGRDGDRKPGEDAPRLYRQHLP